MKVDLIYLLENFPDNKERIVIDDDDLKEGIKPAFGSPGGKFFVAGKLIQMFPEHKRYVEAFIGGGSVLFRKNKQEGVPEFINDRDEEIFHAFKFMQNLTESQLNELNKKEWTTKEEIFNKLLAAHKANPKDGNDVERFYRHVYVKAASDAGEMRSYDGRAEGEVMKVTSRLMKIKERLSDVTIENMDYKEFVKKYANKESFTFLDPPYPSAKMNWKFCPTQEEFEGFTKTVPGKWMVTYEVCDGWKESSYHRRILSQYNLAAPSSGHMTRKSELVVANYPLQKNEESKLLNSINKNISNFIYIKQWRKPSFLEGKKIEDNIIVTESNYNIHISEGDLFDNNFKEGIIYIMPPKDNIFKVAESVMYLPPKSEMNQTLHPAWIKKLDEGKISIKEISDLEKKIELSGGILNERYSIKRESKNSDFWKINKIS